MKEQERKRSSAVIGSDRQHSFDVSGWKYKRITDYSSFAVDISKREHHKTESEQVVGGGVHKDDEEIH